MKVSQRCLSCGSAPTSSSQEYCGKCGGTIHTDYRCGGCNAQISPFLMTCTFPGGGGCGTRNENRKISKWNGGGRLVPDGAGGVAIRYD